MPTSVLRVSLQLRVWVWRVGQHGQVRDGAPNRSGQMKTRALDSLAAGAHGAFWPWGGSVGGGRVQGSTGPRL